MRKPALIIFIQIFVILTLTVIRVAVTNRISTSGIEMASIEQSMDSIKKENLILQEKLLTLSSYTEIASHAAQIGFVPAKNNFAVSSTVPVAIKQ